MKPILPYLVFPGTCKDALNYYAECLNGEVTSITTFGESPIGVTEEYQNRIFNGDLRAGELHIKASDDLPGHEVKMGTHISLYLAFNEQELQHTVFNRLAEGGKVLFPLDGPFGMLKDKFGIQWMLVMKE